MALLAERGITGPLDLFENPRGMRAVFCRGDAAAALTLGLLTSAAVSNPSQATLALPMLSVWKSCCSTRPKTRFRLRCCSA